MKSADSIISEILLGRCGELDKKLICKYDLGVWFVEKCQENVEVFLNGSIY